MTNGNVSLNGEGGNGQHGRIGRCFRQNAFQYADAVAEGIIVRVPKVIQVLGHS